MEEPRVTRCLTIRLLALRVLTATLLLVSVQHVFPPTPVLAQRRDTQQRSQEGDQLMAQGTDHLNQRRFRAALHSFGQAVQLYRGLKDEERLAAAQNNLAKAALLSGDYPQAIALWQRLADRGGNGSRLSNLGLALFESGKLLQAEETLRRAITHWESVRTDSDVDADRIALFEQQAYTYRLLQRVLVAQNRANQALELAEWSRARPLVELLVRREQARIADRPLPSRSLSLDEIKQIARTQRSVLVEYSIVGREIRVLGNEPEDQADLFIWVVKPTGEVAFRRVDLTALRQAPSEDNSAVTDLVRRSRYALGVGGRGLVFQEKREPLTRTNGSAGARGDIYLELQALHRLLIQPIADLLPDNPEAHVTFIPQGPLFLVPFAALQDGAGKYLIEKHTILTAPSIQVLALTQGQRQRLGTRDLASLPDRDVLVAGNPVMPRFSPEPGQPPQPLADLPGAEQEAKAIARLLGTRPLIRDQAAKAIILERLPRSRIVHLATHALLDIDPSLNEFGLPTDPRARTARDSKVFVTPGAVVVGPEVVVGGVPAETALARERVVRVDMPGLIALAPSIGDDGFLSAKEILGMHLVAELVVLSACNTGRGRVTGDGIVGLSRAFIAAGVPSVIVSLWSVPDAPTSSLMTTFYAQLRGSPDKARALRLAALTTLHRYPDPVDWAAFTLVGNAL